MSYPPEEIMITRHLVQMLARAETWQDMIGIADALHTVRRHAESMRAEHEMFQDTGNEAQAATP